jgi:hypothetical protein
MDKETQEIIDGAKNLILTLEECNREDKAMQDGMDFLLNEWKTNKRYFREESGNVTTEDVIKTTFQFAWAAKRCYDHNKDNPNFN